MEGLHTAFDCRIFTQLLLTRLGFESNIIYIKAVAMVKRPKPGGGRNESLVS